MTKIKAAFVGCGRVAFHHMEMLKNINEIDVIATCDLDVVKASKLANEFNAKAYTDYRKMLGEQEVDLVTVATPSGAHFAHLKDILSIKAVNILVEKPMVLKVSHGVELKNIANEKGIRIFPVYQNRFNKAVQRVKQAIENNELGDIHLATVRVRWCRPQRYYDLASWRGTYSMDGGAYVNQGIHFIDLLRFLAGDIREVNSCFGQLGAKIEAEDTGLSLLKFHSGTMGVIEITTAARPDDFEASISIVGSKGLAQIGGWTANELTSFSPNPDEQSRFSEDVKMAYGFGHEELYKQVAMAILKNSPSPIEYDDGLKTIGLLHSLYLSNESKQWVQVDEEKESSRLGEDNAELLSEYLL